MDKNDSFSMCLFGIVSTTELTTDEPSTTDSTTESTTEGKRLNQPFENYIVIACSFKCKRYLQMEVFWGDGEHENKLAGGI